MAKLRAAILAAGRGVRMGGGLPKTLLPVGEREPLLHYLLLGLKDAGVDDLAIVTGHRASDLQAYVDKNWTDSPVQFIFNARYASWGNFHSVRVALDQSPGADLLVVNCDIVIHPDVIRRVIQTPGDLVLAVEKRRHLDDEDMRVELKRDRVMGIGKNIKMVRSHGEYAGVSLLRPRAARAYGDHATELEWRAQTDGYYEDVYGSMIGEVDVRAARVDEGEYAEVDTPADEAAALEVISAHADAWAEPASTSH